ncbi:MAG: hypothetical protein IKS95_05860, partial [Verrucomicrobia bacterium]|nr:hypothetical protein [Verrucomicrobiota bacterium]
SVSEMGSLVFHECKNLKYVYYRGDLPDVKSYIYLYTPQTLTTYYPQGYESWEKVIKDNRWQDRPIAPWYPSQPEME